MRLYIDKPILNEKSIYPSDEVLQEHLGEIKSVWDAMHNCIEENYPSFLFEWRYYNDRKSWLNKLTKKTKTICWISIYPNLFKMTFYFGDKAESLIETSMLRKELKDQFLNGKKTGKIRPITVTLRDIADLTDIKMLIELKEKIIK